MESISIDFFLRRRVRPLSEVDVNDNFCTNHIKRVPRILNLCRMLLDATGSKDCCIAGGFASVLLGRTSIYSGINVFYRPPSDHGTDYDVENTRRLKTKLLNIDAVCRMHRLSFPIYMTALRSTTESEGNVMQYALDTILQLDIPTSMCCIFLLDDTWYSLSLTDDGIIYRNLYLQPRCLKNLFRGSYFFSMEVHNCILSGEPIPCVSRKVNKNCKYFMGVIEGHMYIRILSGISEEKRYRDAWIQKKLRKRKVVYARRRLERVYSPSLLSELAVRVLLNVAYKNI